MIEDPKELLLHVLHAKDAGRDRSKQTQVGPSEIGGCRRKVWYRLNAQPETNDNQSKLAAISQVHFILLSCAPSSNAC